MALQKFGKYVKDSKDARKLEPKYKPLTEKRIPQRIPTPVTTPTVASPQKSGMDTALEEYNRLRKPLPEYEQNGQINPRYKSGTGSNALSGLAIGVQGARGQDPIFGISSAIGGLVAGLFSKNLAGKEKYKREVQETEEYNEDLYSRTNATMRLEALKEQEKLRQAEEVRKTEELARRVKKDETDAQYRESMANAKDAKQRGDAIRFASNNASSPEERANLAKQYYQNFGIEMREGEELEDFGNKFQTKPAGDYLVTTDRYGEFRGVVRGDGGQPITTMKTKDLVGILKTVDDLGDDDVTLESALKQADEVIKKDFNGKVKPNQLNTLRLQIADRIRKDGRNAPISTSITVDGKAFVIDLPKLGQFTNKVEAKGEESPFMPEEKTPVDGKAKSDEILSKLKPEEYKANHDWLKQQVESLDKILKSNGSLSPVEQENYNLLVYAKTKLEEKMATNPSETIVADPTVEKKTKSKLPPKESLPVGHEIRTVIDGESVILRWDGTNYRRKPKRR